jgi:hypothetical protein
LVVVFIVLTSLSFSIEKGWARTAAMQQVCGACHVMHDSLGGSAVVVAAYGPPTTYLGPQQGLINKTCTGCHNGPNSNGSMPYVVNLSALPVYDPTAGTTHDTLAGGNFYWVALGNDLKGHNVDGVGASQAARTPPGGSLTFDATNPLTCAGAYGCHGDGSVGQVNSIWGSHHDNGVAAIDGGSTVNSYRFLTGVTGFEDADWEYSLDSADHNQYKGVDRTADDDIGETLKSISHLCAKCHGDFHSGAYPAGVSEANFGSDPWVRHPVDIDMCDAAGSEYLAYGGLGTNAYVVTSPLGSLDVSAKLANVTLGGACDDKAIITCITCHRAHGSPNDFSLRWDYQAWPGGGYNGCGDCHTAKN